MASRSVSRERYSFANLTEPLELPDLIAVQRESFEWFLNEGLAETFRDISPIKDFSEALQLELEVGQHRGDPRRQLGASHEGGGQRPLPGAVDAREQQRGRMLGGGQGGRIVLEPHVLHLRLADPVFAGASAFQAQGARNQLLIQGFGLIELQHGQSRKSH